jgi:hypothetical protein
MSKPPVVDHAATFAATCAVTQGDDPLTAAKAAYNHAAARVRRALREGTVVLVEVTLRCALLEKKEPDA